MPKTRNSTEKTRRAFRKWKNGKITATEYLDEVAKTKGFKTNKEYTEHLAKTKGFKTVNEYREHVAKLKGFPNLKAQKESSAKTKGFKDSTDYKRKIDKIRRVKRGLPADMKANDKCSLWLGYVRGEEVLCKVFENVERMPITHPNYDFICNKNFKIDVKTTCLSVNNNWMFNINKNKIADYFLLLAFDNRDDLNPQHIWLIKGTEVIRTRPLNNRKISAIKNISKYLKHYEKYELTDKLNKLINYCDKLKNV